MEKLLDAFTKWEPLGQGIFVLIVLSMVFAALAAPFRYLAICVRGWPPPIATDDSDDSDEDPED